MLNPLLHIPTVIINKAKLSQWCMSEIGNKVIATMLPIKRATRFAPKFGKAQAIMGIIITVPNPLNNRT
jgi:hypothetical protein